jgi:tetratricopeptide (TPR) repeat protein
MDSVRDRFPGPRRRVLRVFVSSTFCDMHPERERLIKFTFPELRKICERRGVNWVDIDLRWGITEEQANRGEVLPLCLRAIQQPDTFFIGILGQRYGWVPREEDIPGRFLMSKPCLKRRLSGSMTELEIRYGVFDNPDMAERSFFYFRDPTYVASLPEDKRKLLIEDASPEDVERLGEVEANELAKSRRRLLEKLKKRIRDRHLNVKEYGRPEELGDLVRDDMVGLINRLFPEGSVLSPLDQDAFDHESFAASRRRTYVKRPHDFEELDKHALGADPPLVVTGRPGAGQSALLANWAGDFKERHKDFPLISHFIGANAASCAWRKMLARIIGEVDRLAGTETEVPEDPGALRVAFANSLSIAAADRPLVLIIDDLDQLEDRDGALDLAWLPVEIPDGIRLILSTSGGRPLGGLKRRGWPVFTVDPLTESGTRDLVSAYLGVFEKELGADIVDRIALADQTKNPLYLSALLEELRVFGSHEELTNTVDGLLESATVQELYRKILRRYEEDYDVERPGLVRDSMSLLWTSRRGLSENELRDLLGKPDDPLPATHWSYLRLAAEWSLIERSGLIGFSHGCFREAVAEAYLQSNGIVESHRERLVQYFGPRDVNQRKAEELPWQLMRLSRWTRLKEAVSDLGLFDKVWGLSEFDIKEYWALIERHTGMSKAVAYEDSITIPIVDGNATAVRHLATLIGQTGEHDPASMLWKRLADYYRAAGNDSLLARSLNSQAGLLVQKREWDQVLPLAQEAEEIARRLSDRKTLQRALCNLGNALRGLHRPGEALEKHKEEERICESLGDLYGRSAAFGNQVGDLVMLNDLDAAVNVNEIQMSIAEQSGNLDGLKHALGTRAMLLWHGGDLAGALAVLEQREKICERLGDKFTLLENLENETLVLGRMGDYSGMLRVLHRKCALLDDLGDAERRKACVEKANKVKRLTADPPRGDDQISHLRLLAEVCEITGDHWGQVRALLDWAIHMLESRDQNKKDEALEAAEKARSIAECERFEDLLREIDGLIKLIDRM